jgi:3-oxoacyl-[acyl-carrier-protein] synthase-3
MSDMELTPRRAPIRRLTGVRVVGTGSYVPDRVVANAELAALGCDEQWIEKRTGILQRRHAPPEMATSDLAAAAAQRAIVDAGALAREIDLVLLGTFTPDMPVPATACKIQERLGLSCAAMDVQAACAGFMYALVTGAQYVATGCSRLALVIGADCNSRAINPADKKMYPLFGDGAGAVLLAKGEPDQGLLAYTLGADGSGSALLCRPMGGSRLPPSHEAIVQGQHFLYMDGRPVFRWAVRLVTQSVTEVVAASGLSLGEIDLFFPHQANRRIVDAAAEQLGIRPERVEINVDRYGNTSAGSIPLALDEARRAGRVRRGSRIVLTGFGAGLAWGTAVFAW